IAPLEGTAFGKPLTWLLQLGALELVSLVEVHLYASTVPLLRNDSRQAATVLSLSQIPLSCAARLMSTSEVAKLVKLIGCFRTVRIVVWSYFWAPPCMLGLPVMLPSA